MPEDETERVDTRTAEYIVSPLGALIVGFLAKTTWICDGEWFFGQMFMWKCQRPLAFLDNPAGPWIVGILAGVIVACLFEIARAVRKNSR